jgi:diacylglycerol kinase (ATP)
LVPEPGEQVLDDPLLPHAIRALEVAVREQLSARWLPARRGRRLYRRPGAVGHGNDFARGVGIPIDSRKAARLVRTARAEPVDLLVDDADNVAVNAVHLGAGADAALIAQSWKRLLRRAAFPLGALIAGTTAAGWRLRVEVDGAIIASGRRRMLMVGLSNAPTIAGGTARLGPGASPQDGRVEVTVSLATRWLARLGYARALLRGHHRWFIPTIGNSGNHSR